MNGDIGREWGLDYSGAYFNGLIDDISANARPVPGITLTSFNADAGPDGKGDRYWETLVETGTIALLW